MRTLLNYLNSLNRDEKTAFAQKCGTTLGYLRKAGCLKQELREKVCALAETHSGGAVRRWDLRPSDWWLVWPELVGVEGSPSVPAEKEAVHA